MTIAIGILANDAIIFAADSQTTRGNIKNLNAVKIHNLHFLNGVVMVAEAGNGPRAQRCLEIFRDHIALRTMTGQRDLAEWAEESVSSLRREMLHQRSCNMEELDRYMRDEEQNFWLLIAYYFQGVPFIYSVSLRHIMANLDATNDKRHYSAIGSGADLADYILSEYSRSESDFNTAFATAVYTIEEIKRWDSFCSGKTKVAFTGPENDGGFLMQDVVDDISSALAKFNVTYSAERITRLSEVFKASAQAATAKHKPFSFETPSD